MSQESLRLDRWLWFTRFYKTRTAAGAAVNGGHVHVNGERAKTSVRVRAGDEIRLRRQQLEYTLTVTGIPSRRGPASNARACYEESEDSVIRREQRLTELRRDRRQMPLTRGKPDKHTRRRLRERNRGSD